MAWIEMKIRRDGTTSYWVRDIRGGRQVSIPGGANRKEAEQKLEQYNIRRDLEKEGYDDKHEALLDQLWGSKLDNFKKAGSN